MFYLITWIELGQEVDFNNQTISWATKPSLVVAPGATGHKSKFQALSNVCFSAFQDVKFSTSVNFTFTILGSEVVNAM